MSNGISTLWQGIVDDLNDNKDDLGIGTPGTEDNPNGSPGAERASTGKVTSLSAPSAAIWLVPGAPTLISQNGAVRLSVDIFVYCIAAPTDTEADAVDAALDIAIKVLAHLTNKEIGTVILTQPDSESPLEIVERSSTASVAGVLLKAEVTL